MLQKLINTVMGRRTIDNAVMHFNKAIEGLEAVEKQEVEEIERRKVEIAQSTAALEASTKTANIARNRAAKLRTIFGESEEDSADSINTLRAIL